MAASARHNGFYFDHDADALRILFNGIQEMRFNGIVPEAPTTPDFSTVDGTYGTEERDVIQNLVIRQAEIVAALQARGIMDS